jgi:hypothetical protein
MPERTSHAKAIEIRHGGPRVLASRVEDNLERFLLLHVPKLLSSISTDKLDSEPGLLGEGTDLFKLGAKPCRRCHLIFSGLRGSRSAAEHTRW